MLRMEEITRRAAQTSPSLLLSQEKERTPSSEPRKEGRREGGRNGERAESDFFTSTPLHVAGDESSISPSTSRKRVTDRHQKSPCRLIVRHLHCAPTSNYPSYPSSVLSRYSAAQATAPTNVESLAIMLVDFQASSYHEHVCVRPE